MTALSRAALAPATSRAYDGTWRRLKLFLGVPCTAPFYPVTTSQVADFIAACFTTGCGASTLSSHCSAIAYGHRIRGLADPTADFRIRKLLAGARRLRPSADFRLAISLPELDALCAAVMTLSLPLVDRTAFKAAFCTAFFAMLRPGEVLLGGDPDHTIRLRHVEAHPGWVALTLPSSKTSASPFRTVLDARLDLPSCPVRALRAYLHLRPPGLPQDCLFISSTARPLTTRSLTVTLRRAGQIAGLDISRLSGHCFRIGGASHGARSGMTELQLQEAGRWSSAAVHRYLRRPVSLLQLAAPGRV